MLASTKPSTRFTSEVPAHLKGVVADSPWLYAGTVADYGGNPWVWLPFCQIGDSRKAWTDAARAAAEVGKGEIVLDVEAFRAAMDKDAEAARIAARCAR